MKGEVVIVTPRAKDDVMGASATRPALSGAHPALELRNVAKTFGIARAVADVSLRVAPGEFVTLLGPSGCGKTTLMNMVAGFFPPTDGRILLHGRDVTSQRPHRRDVGIVFQSYALFPHMSVAENLAFGLEERRMARDEIRRRVSDALATVRLPGFGERGIRQLSGGQQQRVALARALIIQPALLLLDEPLSALDKNLRAQMQIEIKQIQRQANVATLFVTHDQAEALSLSDRIAVMNAGRIEQIGTPQEVYAAPTTSFVAAFVGEVNRLGGRIGAIDRDGTIVELDGGGRLLVPGPPRPGSAVGQPVNLFVRPEHVAVAGRDESDLASAIRAKVVAHSYQGTHTQVIVERAGGEPLILVVADPDAIHRHLISSEVALRLDLSRAVLHPA